MLSEGPIVLLKIAAAFLSMLSWIFFILRIVRAYQERGANRLPTESASVEALETKPSQDDIKQWYRRAIAKIVNARVQAECSLESGEPVFLSHYISKGRLRHWVLHVHEHKYELRQVLAEGFWTRKRYKASISPSGFDLLEYQRSVTMHHAPKVDNYFYSMIGWTTLSKKEVDQECDIVGEGFGSYSLFTNNCHDFLQSLADAIVTTRAPDWKWFRDHDATGYEYIEEPGLGYGTISAATCSEHLKRSEHYLSADERMKINDFIDFLDNHVETGFKLRRDPGYALRWMALAINVGISIASC
ncbi:hypothetical protein N7528_007298 [Penicillium herquei]|nr:hypothetical protein N7528_007298 [Penicillium herquei]